MWIQELKIWLVALATPGFCYFYQSAQIHCETYHGELAAYMQEDHPARMMTQSAQKLGIGDSANHPLATCDLTLYFLMHQGGG